MPTSKQTTEQNVKTEPWGPVQDSLKGYLGQVNAFFGGGTPGLSGFGGGPESNIPGAGGGGMSPGVNAFTPTQSDWTKQAYQMIADRAKNGNNTIDTGGFQDLINRAKGPGVAQGYLGDVAAGKFVNGGDAAFNAALDLQSQKTADQIARQFSANGRYGSSALTGTIADQVGGMRTQATAQELAAQRDRQLQAAGLISNESLGRMGAESGGLSALAGIQGQNISNSWIPGQMLQSVGAAQDAFDWQKKQAPYQALTSYGNILAQLGGQGGSQNTTVSQPYSPLMALLGGGIGLGSLLKGFA